MATNDDHDFQFEDLVEKCEEIGEVITSNNTILQKRDEIETFQAFLSDWQEEMEDRIKQIDEQELEEEEIDDDGE